MLRLFAVVALGFALFQSDPALARRRGSRYRVGRLRVTTLMPQFFRYWQRARRLPQAQQSQRFRGAVESLWPDFYRQHVFRKQKSKSAALVRREKMARYLALLPQLVPQMRQVDAALGRNLRRYYDEFVRKVGPFRRDVEVAVLPSVLSFDGATRVVAKRAVLLFGVDGMAFYHKGRRPAAFFFHELFHSYHAQIHEARWRRLMKTQKGVYMYQALWGEGLAVYVSQRLTPYATNPEMLLWEPLVERSRRDLPALAQLALKELDSLSPAVYTKWFLTRSKDSVVPTRAGYYLGLLVAREIGATRSLRQMSRLTEAQVRPLIVAALTRLAKQPRRFRRGMPPRYACASDADCLSSCLLGAVNRRWYQERRSSTKECDDGCASKGYHSRCIAGACVSFNHRGQRVDSCTHR